MSNFALPAGLNYTSQLAPGIPGLRRTIDNAATTQNFYRPGETAIIPLSTGDGGAFWVNETVRVRCRVDVLNYSNFVDFISLGPAGFHCLIKRMCIEINGYEHEVNDYYNYCVSTEMIQKGENQIPYEIVRSNTWEPADGLAGIKHVNFIKPSMITQSGLPHGVQYPPITTSVGSTPDTFTQSLMYYSNPYISVGYGTVKAPNYYDATHFTQPPFNYLQFGGMHSSNWLEGGQNWYIDSIEAPKYLRSEYRGIRASTTALPFSAHANAGEGGYTGSSLGIDHVLNNKALRPGTAQAGAAAGLQTSRIATFETGNISMYNRIVGGPSKTYIGDTSKLIAPTNNEVNIGTVSFGQSVTSFTPIMWPIKQPIDLEKLKKELKDSIVGVNQQNVMSYYANCKNIPVSKPIVITGILNDTLGENLIWGNHDFQSQDYLNKDLLKTSIPGRTSFFIELEIYSSIIGKKAKVWFPETVFQQGTVKLKILFEDPNVAFQVTSDPCRKVPGTPRDCFPNLGVIRTENYTGTGGSPITGVTTTSLQLGSLSQTHPSNLISGVHPIMISNYSAGQCFNDSVCLGKFLVPNIKLDLLHNLTHLYQTFREGAVDGQDTTAIRMFNMEPVPYTVNVNDNSQEKFKTVITAGHETFSNYTFLISAIINELEKNSRYGLAPVQYSAYEADGIPTAQSTIQKYDPTDAGSFYALQISNLQNYYRPSEHQFWTNDSANQINNGSVQCISSKYDGGTNSDDAGIYKNLLSQDAMYQFPNWNPYAPPQVQYIPISDPWNKLLTRNLTIDNFVNENQVYYGTYLKHSKAQVRRTMGVFYPLEIQESGYQFGLFNKLSYEVSQIHVTYEQITLPPDDAANIIENALTSGITIEVDTWKTTTVIPPPSTVQNLLINTTAAYCRDLSLWFVPRDCYQGDISYGYNTMNSFYCPFTSFDYTESDSDLKQYNYLGGTPDFKNALRYNSNMGIKLQAQIGAEYFPRREINTWAELVQYTRWGDQKLGQMKDIDYMNLYPTIQPSYLQSEGFDINTLQNGFTACFLPIRCLDDQSITSNPGWIPIEIAIGALKSKANADGSTDWKGLRGRRHPNGSLPFLVPLDGSFHISFNFETYMGKGDEILTGLPITNSNFFLRMEKAYLLAQRETRIICKLNCNGKFVVGRGSTASFLT